MAYVSAEDLIDPLRSFQSAGLWPIRQLRYLNTRSTWSTDYHALKAPPNSGPSVFFDDVSTEWGGWRIQGRGPDGLCGPPSGAGPGWPGASAYPSLSIPYDPSNGTSSLGDLLRSQRAVSGHLNIPNP